jgi:hypothetical protein
MPSVTVLLRPLPMSSQDKEAEILVLRHQLLVPRRQLSPDRARFAPGDRALLAALLYLWVPETYATRRYSCITPPARSRR